MQFMIVVNTSEDWETEVTPNPGKELLAAMPAYHEDLAKAGALLDFHSRK